MHDQKTGQEHFLFDFLNDKKAQGVCYNSLLSECAALGFEYGYSITDPDTLVLG